MEHQESSSGGGEGICTTAAAVAPPAPLWHSLIQLLVPGAGLFLVLVLSCRMRNGGGGGGLTTVCVDAACFCHSLGLPYLGSVLCLLMLLVHSQYTFTLHMIDCCPARMPWV